MSRGIKWRGDGGVEVARKWEEGKIKDIFLQNLELQYSDWQGALAREQRVRAGDGRWKQ